MAEYQHLTESDKADILARLRSETPDPEKVALAAEKAHYEEVMRAKLRGESVPAFEVADASTVVAADEVLKTEIAAVEKALPVALVDVVVP